MPLTASEANLNIKSPTNHFSEEVTVKSPVKIHLIDEVENSSRDTELLQTREQIIVESELPKDLYSQTEEIINNLNKRQSRRLCKPLGIKQKCGSIEKTLTFIRSEIRSIFKDDPEKAIAAVEKQLPELICVPPKVSESNEKIAS